MRICVDARSLGRVVTGLGQYASQLVRHLACLDRENEYVILRRAPNPAPIVRQTNFVEIALSRGMYSARNILTGSRDINPLKADVYHALFHFLPFGVRAGRTIITLQDLTWVTHRAIAYEEPWRRWLKCGLAGPLIRHAISRADQVITTSASTRQAATARYGFPESKFTAIHLGVEPSFLAPPAGPLPACCRGRRFIFTLGNTLPHKNVPRLVRAFAAVAPHHPDLDLLIAGRGDGYPSLRRLTGELGLSQRVLCTEQLSGEEVHACYAGAALFAFPSLAEGFGLPVLEAMACGCPVLAADIPALAEVAGGAALLADPLEVDAIAAGLLRLLSDDPLRRSLIDRGRRRAAEFSWRECAARTLEVYRS